MFKNGLLVLNGKGGVLKTTLAAQVAGIAAMSGWRVLLVDLDQQANLSRDLGYTDRSDGGRALFQAVADGLPLVPIPDVRPNLDVIAAGPDTLRMYREIAGPLYDEIDRVLSPLASNYDLVVIDSPPGGENIHLAAMTAARFVLIPTQPDQASVDGLATVMRSMTAVKRSTNSMIEILGVVIGPVATAATRLQADTRSRLAGHLGDKVHVFDQVIRNAQLVAVHCRDTGNLVHEYEEVAKSQPHWSKRRNTKSFSAAAPGLASDYQKLTHEVLKRFTEQSNVGAT